MKNLFLKVIVLPLLLSKIAEADVVLTIPYQITNGFVDADRVKNLNFDFSSMLAALPVESIERIEWTVQHQTSVASVTLTTDHPSGANCSVQLNRWINGFSSLTPGFRVPQSNVNNQIGMWLHHDSNSVRFTLPQSPYQIDYLQASNLQQFSEIDPSRFLKYYQPFTIEIIAAQFVNISSYTFGLAAPQASQTAATFSGAVTIRIVTVVPPVDPKLVGTVIVPSIQGVPGRITTSVIGGHPNGTARLQASVDLGRTDPWVEISAAVLDSNGTATFTNVSDARPQASGSPTDYFRVISEPNASP